MSIVILDTETTGLDLYNDQVFEIAVYDLDTDRSKVWTLEPAPGVVENMHPRALEVNRYHERTTSPDWVWTATNEQVNEYGEALQDLRGWLTGKHILGAVPNFDTERIARMYFEWGDEAPHWHHHLIDIEAVAVGWLMHEARRNPDKADEINSLLELPYRSDDLAAYMGVEPPSEQERHTALGDVLWTKRWWDRLRAAA